MGRSCGKNWIWKTAKESRFRKSEMKGRRGRPRSRREDSITRDLERVGANWRKEQQMEGIGKC